MNPVYPVPVIRGPIRSASTRSVVCIGVFDGVHRGHRALLREGRIMAERTGLPLVALTFDPHPMAVLRPGSAPEQLSTFDHRVFLLADVGVDEVRVLEFDRSVASLSPEDFARAYLATDLNAAMVVVGENFRFGHRASGDPTVLRNLGESMGFTVDGIGLSGDEQLHPWSSSRIRDLVQAGDVTHAAVGLLRYHRVEGPVVRGDGRGRELGVPTANIDVPAGTCRPADGVYAAWLTIEPYAGHARRVPAAVSVGANRTFGGTEPRVEAHIIDGGSWDLYGSGVAADFVERLRPMREFHSVNALIRAMRSDIAEAGRRLTS